MEGKLCATFFVVVSHMEPGREDGGKAVRNVFADVSHMEPDHGDGGNDGAVVFSRRRGLSPCGGQSAGTALMAVACGGRVSLLT